MEDTIRHPLAARRAWVFDLDNTLYPPHICLFDQIEKKMTGYVMEQLGIAERDADQMRRHYWKTYGTTLAGLMLEHGMDPAPYLVAVHDISLNHVPADPALGEAIAALPGRRIVYTNGSAPYARRVLAARGLVGLFDAVYGVEHADFHPKPQRPAFETIFALDGLSPGDAVMFEDDPRNLFVPHDMGMGTVHVAPDPDPHDHIHFHTDDLTGFLRQILDHV